MTPMSEVEADFGYKPGESKVVMITVRREGTPPKNQNKRDPNPQGSSDFRGRDQGVLVSRDLACFCASPRLGSERVNLNPMVLWKSLSNA